jgi:peroxiredoxin Q/BCP
MHLQVGDKAPHFTGKDQQGHPISLEDFKDKKLILYFYPKDNTVGCTLQACNLRDHYETLQEAGYEILGVSTDNQTSHKKFADQYRLPFQLLVDEDRTVHGKYGTWTEKSLFGRKYTGTARTTFIIDEQGTIERIIDKVKTVQHAKQILKRDWKQPA